MLLERGVDPRTVERSFTLEGGPLVLRRNGYFYVIDQLFLLKCVPSSEGGMKLEVWLPLDLPVALERSFRDPRNLERFMNPPRVIDLTIIRDIQFRLSSGRERSRVFLGKYCVGLEDKQEPNMVLGVSSTEPIAKIKRYHPGFNNPETALRGSLARRSQCQ